MDALIRLLTTRGYHGRAYTFIVTTRGHHGRAYTFINYTR